MESYDPGLEYFYEWRRRGKDQIFEGWKQAIAIAPVQEAVNKTGSKEMG